MIVITANYLPDAVRGKLKLWFVEPQPNVFVSGIKEQLAQKVAAIVLKHCPPEAGLLIFVETSQAPFFQIFAKGNPKKNIANVFGLQLISERNCNSAV